jgi:hypothetical protein
MIASRLNCTASSGLHVHPTVHSEPAAPGQHKKVIQLGKVFGLAPC